MPWVTPELWQRRRHIVAAALAATPPKIVAVFAASDVFDAGRLLYTAAPYKDSHENRSETQGTAAPLLGQAVLLCFVSAVFTLVVAVGYGILTSFGRWLALGISAFLPSTYAWEAAVLMGIGVALFNTTGDSVELDCDQGRKSHSAVTYGLALATTALFALVLERISHGTWLQPYFQTWGGAAVVGAFLVTNLVAIRWHRNSLLSKPRQ